MDYFLADTHFGFLTKKEEMYHMFHSTKEKDELIINNWNKVVKPTDDVWFLGDFCHDTKYFNPVPYLKALPGKKHLIAGNHDVKMSKNVEYMKYWDSYDQLRTIYIDKLSIVLCHYPLAEWNGYFRNHIHIYGHIHSDMNMPGMYMLQQVDAFNAGAIVNNYTPATLRDLYNNKMQFIAMYNQSHNTFMG